jgi:hypothetical protein
MSELDHDKYTPSSTPSPRVPNVSAQPTKFAPQFSPARRSPPRARGVRDPERPTQADNENPAWIEFNIAKDAYTRGMDLIQLQDKALKATPAGERSSGRRVWTDCPTRSGWSFQLYCDARAASEPYARACRRVVEVAETAGAKAVSQSIDALPPLPAPVLRKPSAAASRR